MLYMKFFLYFLLKKTLSPFAQPGLSVDGFI